MEIVTLTGRRADSDILRAPLVNAHSALSIPAYWQGIHFIVDNLASFGRSVADDGAKLVERHPLDRALRRKPNQYQNAYQHFRTWFFHAVHCGNGYDYIHRDPSGGFAGLYNLSPDDVTPFRVLDDDGDIATGSLWYWHEPSKRAIPSADILHLPGLSFDGLKGYSPVAICAQTFETAALVESRTARTMKRGTNIIGAVEIPADTPLEKQEQIVHDLKKFRDPNSASDVIVLSGGAKLNNAALSPQQMQLIEQGAVTTKRIAQVLNVDPVYLFERGESKYTNNAEQAGQDVVRFTFRTWIEAAEAELSAKLLTEDEQDNGRTIKLNPDALLRGDTLTQMRVVAQGVGAGLTSKNEGRARLGLPEDPAPESDLLLTPHSVASAPTEGGANG